MEYILRKTTLHTTEIRADIDGDDKTPEQIRNELTTLAHLHGWKESVTNHKTTLSTVGEIGSSAMVEQWDD